VKERHKKKQRISNDEVVRLEMLYLKDFPYDGCFLFNLLTFQLFNPLFQGTKADISGQIGQKRP
jgi:hypothetical protein